MSCRAFDALLYQCSGAAAGVEAGRLEAFFGVPGRGDAFLQGREAGGQALVKILGDGGQAQAHENQVTDLQADTGPGSGSGGSADAECEGPRCAAGHGADRHAAAENHRDFLDQLQQHRQDLLDFNRGPFALEVHLDDRVGEGHRLMHRIDAMTAHVAIGLARAIADTPGEAVPVVVNALQAVVDALVQLAEFLVEVAFDIGPAGHVG
ncbi:hypothetical protein D3C72_754260 [compost metagenome]